MSWGVGGGDYRKTWSSKCKHHVAWQSQALNDWYHWHHRRGQFRHLEQGCSISTGIICSFYVALCYLLYEGTAVWPSQDTTDHIHLLLRLSSLDNIRLETFPLLTWHEFLNSPFGFQCIKLYKKFMYGCHYNIKQKSKKREPTVCRHIQYTCPRTNTGPVVASRCILTYWSYCLLLLNMHGHAALSLFAIGTVLIMFHCTLYLLQYMCMHCLYERHKWNIDW